MDALRLLAQVRGLLVERVQHEGPASVTVTIGVASFVVFDVGFVPPYGRLTVTNPLDWLVLVTTLGGIEVAGLSGIVVGPLVAALFITGWQILTDEREGRRVTAGVDAEDAPREARSHSTSSVISPWTSTGLGPNISGICPPTRSLIAGPALLYGTCVSLTPVIT